MSEALRNTQKKRIEAIQVATGLELSPLATGAGLAVSTLTRFMNSPDATHCLSAATWEKIERAYPEAKEGAIPADQRIEAVRAVAKVLGVDPAKAAGLTDRQREWIEAVERLPAAIENNTLNVIRGLGRDSPDPPTPKEEKSDPSKSLRGRRSR